jgi:hypothetical protein
MTAATARSSATAAMSAAVLDPSGPVKPLVGADFAATIRPPGNGGGFNQTGRDTDGYLSMEGNRVNSR